LKQKKAKGPANAGNLYARVSKRSLVSMSSR